MINPDVITTKRVGELPPLPINLTDNIPHEIGTELFRTTVQDLADLVKGYIGTVSSLAFNPTTVPDGGTLPDTTTTEWILVGTGTFHNVAGFPDITTTEELNALVSNGTSWSIGVEIPINVELAGIVQTIRSGYLQTTPSEDAVFRALAQYPTIDVVNAGLAAVATPDATDIVKGKLKLAGDLGGTADLPIVSDLNKIKTLARIKLTENICQIVGNELYISSKYGASNDWLCVFKKCMFNELYTFSRVGIVANSNTSPDPTKLTSTPTTILNEVGSDNIGPVNITTYGFIGGNHSLGNDGITKTAINVSYKIYLDGIELIDTDMHSFNEMKILVVNTIYDPATMPTLTGLITESVTYIVKNGSIDVSVNHDYLKNISIVQYYGMQSNYSTAYTHLYFGNSQYNDRITTYGIGVDADSGSRTTYPDVDKIVLSNVSKGNVQSMLLNTNVGLGKNRIAYVTSDPLAFSTGKEYFRLIMGQSFTAGTSNHWNGAYTWYNQNENSTSLHTNTIFAYETLRGGETVYTVDTKGSINQNYPIFESQGKDIAAIKKKETTVVAYLALKDGANVITSGSDNIIFQQGKGISSYVSNKLDRIVNGDVGFLPKIAGGKILNQSSLFEDGSGNVSLGIATPLSGGGGLKWFSSNGFITAFSGVVKAYNYADALFKYLLTGSGIGYKIQVNNGVDALTINSDTTVKINTLSGTGSRTVVADASGNLSAIDTAPTSGTYTPIASSPVNISSSTMNLSTYARIGNIVTVSIGMLVTSTSANTNSTLVITLPIAKSSSSVQRVGSGILYSTNTPLSMIPVAVETSGTGIILIRFVSPSGVLNSQGNITFQYDVTQ